MKKLLQAREGRLEGVPEIIEGGVCVGLQEHHSLLFAVHHQLPAQPLPQAAREGVVEHQCLGKPLLDGPPRAVAPVLDPGTWDRRPSWSSTSDSLSYLQDMGFAGRISSASHLHTLNTNES
ncbi:hypothetical protein NL676_030246 [Syzygium grande]|nr:hypothetical protein NL676_030246 [Syzygium grande]